MTDVWASHLAQLRDSEQGRLLGVTLALAGEVMMLKAEVHRLRHALLDGGDLDPQVEEAAGESTDFRAWLQAEQAAFARCLLKPWTEPDEAPDTSGIS